MSKTYANVFVRLNEDGSGVHIPMDNIQVSMFDKKHNIFMNQDTQEVVIQYVFRRKTNYSRALSDGWEEIEVKGISDES